MFMGLLPYCTSQKVPCEGNGGGGGGGTSILIPPSGGGTQVQHFPLSLLKELKAS